MSTSGIERLGFTKSISPKDKLSSKKGSKKSSQGTGKISDSLKISSKAKEVSSMMNTLRDVQNQLDANPKVAGKVHNEFDSGFLGDLFGDNSRNIEKVLKGVTQEIKNNVSAAVNVHSNMDAVEVQSFIS